MTDKRMGHIGKSIQAEQTIEHDSTSYYKFVLWSPGYALLFLVIGFLFNFLKYFIFLQIKPN